MKTNRLVWIVLVIALLPWFHSLSQIRRLQEGLISQQCARERDQCISQCDGLHAQRTAPILFERSRAELAHAQAILECRLDNIGQPTLIQQCQLEENDRFALQSQFLDARIDQLEQDFRHCKEACNQEAISCQSGNNAPALRPDIPVDLPIEFVDVGPALVGVIKIPDICQRISGPCSGCIDSFCPGQDWNFITEPGLKIILVAAPSLSEKGRDLATAKPKGKNYSLTTPVDINLGHAEKLFVHVSGPNVKQGLEFKLISSSK